MPRTRLYNLHEPVEPHAHAMHRSGVLAELTSRGYPALALDLRGHGESPVRVRAGTPTPTPGENPNPNPWREP